MSHDPKVLRVYATIFRLPRRDPVYNIPLPPSEVSLTAAWALESMAERIESEK